MESSDLITVKEVAEIFGKSKNAVNCWHKRGYLPAEKKIDGRLYFSKAFILQVKEVYHGNISLAVKGAMNMNHSAQIKLDFSEKFTPQFPTKTISLNDAQKLLGVDEDFLIGKVDNAELSTIEGKFYAEQILQLKFSNDEFAEKNCQGSLFTGDGGIDETLDKIKAANKAQVARIDAIQINHAEWKYLLKLVRDYYSKGNVYLQVPLLDENLRGQLLKILPNDSNYISVDNEKLAWCTKDKNVIETLIQTSEKIATSIDENTTEPSTTENAVATPTLETLETLTAEIQSYFVKMSENIIEIGKRLIKAKELVPHGQWQNWLEENFSLSQMTANNFMRVAERFGKIKIDFNFRPTQLIAMLALPAGDEEKFIAEKSAEGTPIENLSVRKLKAEIKEWKDAAQVTDADFVDDSQFEVADVCKFEKVGKVANDCKFEIADVEIVDDDSADDSKIVTSNSEIIDAESAVEVIDNSAQDTTPRDNTDAEIDSAREKLEQIFQLADELQMTNYYKVIAAVKVIDDFPTNAEKTIDLMKNLLNMEE